MKWRTSVLNLLGLALLSLAGCSSGNQCKPRDHSECRSDAVYWIDSCGVQGVKLEDCSCGCQTDGTACREPDCVGKCCGDDGCGGACLDLCAQTSQTCNLGACLCEGICVPNCQGRVCGPDGCGGVCGTCGAGLSCQDGQCLQCPGALCQDECCDAGQICRLDCQDPDACDIIQSGSGCGAGGDCTYIRNEYNQVTQTPCDDNGRECTRASDCQGICMTDCQPNRGNPCSVVGSLAHCSEFKECVWTYDESGNAVQTPSSGYCSAFSCPFLYLWDGESYSYQTDLGGSVLAWGLDLMRPEFYQGGVYELGNYRARDGVYRMKVRETIHEADFFDQVELLVVDLPPGYRALSLWSFTSQLGVTSPEDLVPVRNPRPPVLARDVNGDDVLVQVSRRDGIPLPVTEDGLSRVVVDFGPVKRPQHAKLILTVWSHFQDLRDFQLPPHLAGTSIETPDGNGGWTLRQTAGRNPGDRHTWAVDIAGILDSGSSRMRITLAHTPWSLDVLDQVLLDDSAPVDFQVTRVRARRADLHFAGSANYKYSSLSRRIDADDAHNPVIRDAMFYGAFTRYGDVLPLLTESDDRFVVMAHGDELTLEFEEPPRAAGTTRRVLLDADVFYSIKRSIFGKCTDSVDPLPFHGMTAYPYDPADWPYADDADYRRYQEDWNTRAIDRD